MGPCALASVTKEHSNTAGPRTLISILLLNLALWIVRSPYRDGSPSVYHCGTGEFTQRRGRMQVLHVPMLVAFGPRGHVWRPRKLLTLGGSRQPQRHRLRVSPCVVPAQRNGNFSRERFRASK